MTNIYEEVELLTITYKSSHIINRSLSNISEKFKLTIVENSNDINFKQKIGDRTHFKSRLATLSFPSK